MTWFKTTKVQRRARGPVPLVAAQRQGASKPQRYHALRMAVHDW
jgi:hypothetical protein